MPALSATKVDGPSKIRSKLPPPSISVKLFMLVTALVFSVWLLNQAIVFSDYLYTYLGEVIEETVQPHDLYFVKNLFPAAKPSLMKTTSKQVKHIERRRDLSGGGDPQAGD